MRSLHVTGFALVIFWLTCAEGGTRSTQSPHRSHKLIQPHAAKTEKTVERGRVLNLFKKGWDGHALSQIGKIHVIKKPGWGASNYAAGSGWGWDGGGWGWNSGSKKTSLKEKLVAKIPKKSFGVQWKGGVGFSFGGKGDHKAAAGYDQSQGIGHGWGNYGPKSTGWGQNLGWAQNYGWGGWGQPVEVHHHHHGGHGGHDSGGWGHHWDGDYDDDVEEDDDADDDDDDEVRRLRRLKKKNKNRTRNNGADYDDDEEQEVEEVDEEVDVDEEEEAERKRQLKNKNRRKNEEYGDDYVEIEDDNDARELVQSIDALGTKFAYQSAEDTSPGGRTLLSDIYHVQDGDYFDYEPVVPQFYSVDRYGDY